MADWIFDGANKIIKEPVGSGNTNFNAERDIYSAWKRWVSSGNGEYLQAFIAEGGTPIGATGTFTGKTLLLTNGWKLMAANHDHQVIINGNLFSDDGVVSIANPTGSSTLFITSSVNAQGVATGGVQQAVLDSINFKLQEIYQLQGLDVNNPLVGNENQLSTGTIDIEITGDCDGTTILTRQ